MIELDHTTATPSFFALLFSLVEILSLITKNVLKQVDLYFKCVEIILTDWKLFFFLNILRKSLLGLNNLHNWLKSISGDSYSTHHCVYYNKVGRSSLTERCNLHWHLFIYEAIIGDLPSYISSSLIWSPESYHTCSSDWLTLEALGVCTEFGKTPFGFSALKNMEQLTIHPKTQYTGFLWSN